MTLFGIDEGKLRTDGGRQGDETRHRILRSLREQLQRHPAIVDAKGIPEGRYAEIEGTAKPAYFDRDADSAMIRIAWQPTPTFPPNTGIEERRRTSLTANFAFHYSESTGFDCGWHLEPNPHVDGHLHYQVRDGASEEYSYEPFSVAAGSPVGVLWEILDALEARLRE